MLLFWRLLIGLAALYVVILVLIASLQRRMIFVPGLRRPDIHLAGLPGLVEVEVATPDGLRLLAWYRPAAPGRPTLVYFHGNSGTLENRIGRMRALDGTGWGLLFLEYRGYGGNPGSPSELGFAEDARGAAQFLAARGVAPERLILYGESIGTGVATRLATEIPVAALLLESPYTSIADIGQRRFPFLPVRPLLRDPFDLLARISAVRAPVLVMQGGRDMVVPPDMGRAVFAAAREPKAFWLAPEGRHNDLLHHGITEAAIGFVKKHVPGG